MSGSLFVWVPVLLASVWAAHWGAERLSHPLQKLRRGWGISAAAGGSFVGLTAASPEIGINLTSAVRGVGDIGLGAMLGSNIVAIPIMVTTAYVATRKQRLGEDVGGHAGHAGHLREHRLAVDPAAVTVQALPYLAIIGVFALLTLPAPWRGLQPVDGWILLLAYLAYLAQALLRGRQDPQEVEWKGRERWMAATGVGAIAVGAYFTVFATEKIVSALGIPRIVGGLFITAPMAALPEVFATWSVARSGQVGSAITSVIGDHAVTMTIAFIPLTVLGMQVEDFRLFWVSLAFVALMPALYAGFIHFGGKGGKHGFRRWHLFAFGAAYLAYIALVLFWIQPSAGGPDGGG
ncbi:sodium:calcium antiporter [Falsiroseomonas sp.]|uniref:sodium:calcium antiporter n=1 Tax=Falsiroseomonas sp. TaxID=2870721 RepID=UPI00356AC437